MPLKLIFKLAEYVFNKITRLCEDMTINLWKLNTCPSYYPNEVDKIHIRFHYLQKNSNIDYGKTYDIVVFKKQLVITCKTHKYSSQKKIIRRYQYQKSF